MPSQTPINVLFVCTGNTCRSPMAEGLLRAEIENRPHITARSAGISAGTGQQPSSGAVLAMREIGIDLMSHRSQPVSPELVAEATHILCMTRDHLFMMEQFFPESAPKLFLLRSFLDGDLDVSDPIGQGPVEYEICRDKIHDAITAFLKKSDTTPK